MEETQHAYLYVNDNPVNGSDPSGLFAANPCEAPGAAENCLKPHGGSWSGVFIALGVAAGLVLLGVVTGGAGDAIVGGVEVGADAAEVGASVAAEGGADEVNLSFSQKILDQLGPRDWTQDTVDETVKDPAQTHNVWDYTASGGRQAATAYVRSDGAYVVVNDSTGEVVQVSDGTNPDWKPIWESPRFSR